MTRDDRPTHESTVELIGGLIGDAKDLAATHLAGLRLEVKEELRDLKRSSKYAAAASAAFAVGALLATLALVHALWLYTALPQWAAYGVFALAFLAVGAVLVIARSRMSQDIDLVPETGLLRLERDAKWMARRTREAMG